MSTVLVSDALLHRAVDWAVLLGSGRASDQDRHRFEQWLADDPVHALAWAEVDGVMRQPLSTVTEAAGTAQGRAARSVLLQPGGVDRRRLLKLALSLSGIAVGAALTDRFVPLAGLSTSFSAPTGERRTYALDDGSLLTLNARSIADVRYDDSRRLVELRQGALYAEARDDSRPFIVSTPFGSVSTGASHLAVSLLERYARADALEGLLLLEPQQGASLQLPQAASGGFDRGRAWLLDGAAAASWRVGVLNVRDQSLAEVVDQLRAYQAGLIRVSPEVAALRVFGVFPLDQPARALDALAETLPLRVRRYGNWLTMIDSA